MERDLKDAIEYNDLMIAYQPLVGPSGEPILGVEALCRWHHPTRGDIPPAKFIPVAEHSELIIPLGEWVLRQACLEAKAWPALTLAVNVSPLQFRRPDFVKVVGRILEEGSRFGTAGVAVGMVDYRHCAGDAGRDERHRRDARGGHFELSPAGA